MSTKKASQYNFSTLILAYPELKNYVFLNKYGTISIDFFNQDAVKALNTALLISQYGITKWDIPEGYLCPPIPGRANYIDSIVKFIRDQKKGLKLKKEPTVKCLDIGTGANCIYPIIGSHKYGWNFVATDSDTTAIENAKKIVSENPSLQNSVEIREQKDSNSIFEGIISSDEYFDLSICNPPFHSSKEEADSATLRKLTNLKGEQIEKVEHNFGGSSNELWCKGGELLFLTKMIKESIKFQKNCGWFTSLVSKESTLDEIYPLLKSSGVSKFRTIDMQLGNKISRIIAWQF